MLLSGGDAYHCPYTFITRGSTFVCVDLLSGLHGVDGHAVSVVRLTGDCKLPLGLNVSCWDRVSLLVEDNGWIFEHIAGVCTMVL